MIMIQSVSETLKVKKGKAGTVPSHNYFPNLKIKKKKNEKQLYNL